ncbi:MAG: adenylate/guanylate cyclase domain-containing protein [Deltaproteobacteria bacterium]|nr:adenylate/guanylate cyclase domain-containing protein [Deltaproteobacteria bacterium]
MNSSTQRFRILWFISFLLALWILISSLGIFQVRRIGLLLHADQLWSGFKQSLELEWKLNSRKLSDQIEVLKLEYPNRVDFWFDEKTKSELSKKLRTYSGPILLNFEPQRLLADAAMKNIFLNPNLIRPIRIDTDYDGRLSEEKIISEMFFDFANEEFSQVVGAPRSVYPKDLQYYENHSFGSLDLYKDIRSNRLDYYPLYSKASVYPFPTLGLAALSALRFCVTKPRLSNHFQEIFCEDESVAKRLPTLLPLFFYQASQNYLLTPYQTVEALKDSKKLLIVEVVDSASPFFNIRDEKISFGTYLATAISNVLQGDFYRRPVALKWGEFGLGIFFCLIIFFIARRYKLLTLFSVVFLSLVGFVALDLFLSIIFHWRTQPVEFLTALSLISVAAIVIKSIRDFEDRNLLEKAFSGYVSGERLKRLMSGEEKLDLAGKKATISTLIIDLAGFSRISEKLSPEEVFLHLQRFFSIVDPIIFEFGGIIDKKMGDGLLAFFGDQKESLSSQAAQDAIRAAIKIQQSLREEFPARVGVNTGSVFLGNAGSQRHFNYTVLGESVNFTQRLEAACPTSSVLVGPNTFALAKESFKFRELKIAVKNQQDHSIAFEVLF